MSCEIAKESIVATVRVFESGFLSFRFNPKDDELLSYYLSNKIKGTPLPLNLIVECDIYGDKTAGGGEWHGNKSGKEVMDRKIKKVIGVQKQFSFKPRKGKKGASSTSTSKAEATGWIMHEYSMMGEKNSDDGYWRGCYGRKCGAHQVHLIQDDKINNGEAVPPENAMFDQVDMIEDGNQINNGGLYNQLNNCEAAMAENVRLDQEYVDGGGNQINNGGPAAMTGADVMKNAAEPHVELQTEYGVEPEWVYLEKGSWFYDFDPVEIACMFWMMLLRRTLLVRNLPCKGRMTQDKKILKGPYIN
ncbi:conserved hypothetical protein [Ricinus communis]|uniref:NAC domain-containing protein n=1 Tax=Ricinus communis TaxID=3988 RepID=B9SIZ0_RICCO|nr:conserved hypothetical protein [Ricinus communis]